MLCFNETNETRQICVNDINKEKNGNINKYHFIKLGTVGSTNDYARKLALDGAVERTVVTAEKQTDGRGQKGRTFYSPEKTGLYMSVILRPGIRADRVMYITLAAGAAMAEAIEAVSGRKTQVKWVNDILMDGRKVCGILTESRTDSEGITEFAVVGLGVNITPPEEGFAEEIKDIAGSILPEGTKCAEEAKEKLAGEFLRRFEEYYTEVKEKGPEGPFMNEYLKRLTGGKDSFVFPGGNLILE